VANPNETKDTIIVVSPTAANPNACNFGPNLPTHTYGAHTALQLPFNLRFNARGEYLTGHYMYDGAAYNAVTRSVRWPGCYDYYNLQETGGAPTAMQRARCNPAISKADYFIYPANFFKLRDVSMAWQMPQRFIPGASSAFLTLAGHNIYKWVNKDFPVFDPETGNNGGFDSKVRSILEHVPPPATYTATLRVTF
jgi:hypothetical protein